MTAARVMSAPGGPRQDPPPQQPPPQPSKALHPKATGRGHGTRIRCGTTRFGAGHSLPGQGNLHREKRCRAG
jgi:hypothetical protein